jgi:hypothetical protein
MEDFVRVNAIRLGENGSGTGAGGGGGTVVLSYTHVQSTAAMTWYVQHNFGTAEPLLVFVTDASGHLVWCEEDYPSSTMNLLVLRFGIVMAGKAIVKKIG